jgi:hypothetical protein
VLSRWVFVDERVRWLECSNRYLYMVEASWR